MPLAFPRNSAMANEAGTRRTCAALGNSALEGSGPASALGEADFVPALGTRVPICRGERGQSTRDKAGEEVLTNARHASDYSLLGSD